MAVAVEVPSDIEMRDPFVFGAAVAGCDVNHRMRGPRYRFQPADTGVAPVGEQAIAAGHRGDVHEQHAQSELLFDGARPLVAVEEEKLNMACAPRVHADDRELRATGTIERAGEHGLMERGRSRDLVGLEERLGLLRGRRRSGTREAGGESQCPQ